MSSLLEKWELAISQKEKFVEYYLFVAVSEHTIDPWW